MGDETDQVKTEWMIGGVGENTCTLMSEVPLLPYFTKLHYRRLMK